MAGNGKDQDLVQVLLEKVDSMLELQQEMQETIEELVEKVEDLEITSNEGFRYDA